MTLEKSEFADFCEEIFEFLNTQAGLREKVFKEEQISEPFSVFIAMSRAQEILPAEAARFYILEVRDPEKIYAPLRNFLDRRGVSEVEIPEERERDFIFFSLPFSEDYCVVSVIPYPHLENSMSLTMMRLEAF